MHSICAGWGPAGRRGCDIQWRHSTGDFLVDGGTLGLNCRDDYINLHRALESVFWENTGTSLDSAITHMQTASDNKFLRVKYRCQHLPSSPAMIQCSQGQGPLAQGFQAYVSATTSQGPAQHRGQCWLHSDRLFNAWPTDGILELECGCESWRCGGWCREACSVKPG